MNSPTMPSVSSLQPENRFLPLAIGASVVLHALLLAIRFVPPETFHFKPQDTGMEVILVNAKHAKAPTKADFLAQTNLEGGGNAEEGHSRSPLPDSGKMNDGDNLTVASSRIEQLEKEQQQILSQAKKALTTTAPLSDERKPDRANPTASGPETFDSSKVLDRSVAEIHQRIEDQNKRPRKTFITPATKAVGYAQYYKEFARKVEDLGTVNFPQKDGKKLYGQLLLEIPIYQDGSIYEEEGGIKIERSSGNPALDKAAIRIVKRSAPFGKFPANMRSKDKDDIWVVLTHFNFTRDQKLEAELRGSE